MVEVEELLQLTTIDDLCKSRSKRDLHRFICANLVLNEIYTNHFQKFFNFFFIDFFLEKIFFSLRVIFRLKFICVKEISF